MRAFSNWVFLVAGVEAERGPCFLCALLKLVGFQYVEQPRRASTLLFIFLAELLLLRGFES